MERLSVGQTKVNMNLLWILLVIIVVLLVLALIAHR